MSKAILEFNLPEEEAELDMALHAGDLHATLWDIAQEVFRPARKHGYNDSTLQRLVEQLDSIVDTMEKADDWPTDEHGPLNATDLIGLLEKKFYSLLEQHKVEL